MRRTIALIVLPVLLVGGVLVWWFWDRMPWWTAPEPEGVSEYLPADAAGVIFLDLRQLREAPATRELMPALRRLAKRGQANLGWGECTRIDLADLDNLRVVLPAKDPGGGMWFLHGPIDPGNFKLVPSCLEESYHHGRRTWEYSDPEFGTWRLWVSGEDLVAAPPARLDRILSARRSPATSSAEPPVAALLAKVDRRGAIWVAVSFKALGPLGRPANRAVDLIVGPVLRQAQTVAGGFTLGEKVHGEFVFTTADATTAESLEQDLHRILIVADAADKLGMVERDFRPLMELLRGGAVSRNGTTVTLRCESAGR